MSAITITRNLLITIENLVRSFRVNLGIFLALYFQAWAVLFKVSRPQRRVFVRRLIEQIHYSGVQLLSPVLILGMLFGAVVILQVFTHFPDLGAETIIGRIYAVVILNEIVYMLTTFIMVARNTVTITRTIAEMRVNGEFDMLLAQGIDPAVLLFAPRLWGLQIAMIGLNTFFGLSILAGSFGSAVLMASVRYAELLEGFFSGISFLDVVVMFSRVYFLSLGIVLIPIMEALKMPPSVTEIPSATAKALTRSILYIAFVNIIITVFIYL